MAYSLHFSLAGLNGWNTKSFCNNTSIARGGKVQDVTTDISKVTCKRCLSKIERYKETEKGRKILLNTGVIL